MGCNSSQHAKHADDVLFQEVAGESVLLNLATESYFGLDPVGTRLWQLLGEESSIAAALETMSEEYDVDGSTLESDVLVLIDKMAEAGLVTLE